MSEQLGHARIAHERDGQDVVSLGGYRLLEAFGAVADEDVLADTRTKINRAMEDYPELAGETVTVARRSEWDDRLGRADARNRIIYLPTDHCTSWITTYHELAHLAIEVMDERGGDVPTSSEPFAGIVGVSRMPADRIDEKRVPYLGVPREPPAEWPAICQRALAYREDHHAHQAVPRVAGGRWGMTDRIIDSRDVELLVGTVIATVWLFAALMMHGVLSLDNSIVGGVLAVVYGAQFIVAAVVTVVVIGRAARVVEDYYRGELL